MWSMTTYKLKIGRLGRETYLSRTEDHIFALKSSTTTIKSLDSAQKGAIRLVETKNFLRLIIRVKPPCNSCHLSVTVLMN